jgi:signal transduction histidine kinase
MRNSLAQPSLSRDFVLLSVAVLFVVILISGWVTYKTYNKHSELVTIELEKEAARIESTISTEMGNASYMLASLGRQIIIDPDRDYTKLAQALKSFDNKNHIYSIFSWTNTDKKMVISSNKGVLKEPVDISDRDFIQQAATDSWKMHIGRPIEGRVSGRWVIPVSMGITDDTGKFIGIISLSIDIEVLTNHIRNLVKRDGVSFAVVTKDLVTLTEISDSKNFISDNFPSKKLVDVDLDKKPSGLIAKGSLLWGTGIYAYYRVSEDFPYIVMMGYDANYSDETVRTMLWSRLLLILSVAVFLVAFLWVVRVRVIKPVLDITEIVSSISRGEKFMPLPKKGSVEIEGLAAQVYTVSKYIDESKRIESELRNKMFLLKKSKENAEINMRSKSEFLAYIAQEIRMPINNIIGFSQVLKDQIYGAIENKKYKQYSADIFAIANQLINKIQDIIVHSKVDVGYIDLQEKPVEFSSIVSTSLRQLTDKLQANEISIKVDLQEHLPRLLVDEFRLQQIIINLLLVVLDGIKADGFIRLEAKIINEHRERQFLALTIGNSNSLPVSKDRLFALASRLFASMSGDINGSGNTNVPTSESPDLRFELAKILVSLHGCALHTEVVGEEVKSYVVFFPPSRLIFDGNTEDQIKMI